MHYPKLAESPPCVSKIGMMIERELFNAVNGFSEQYAKDNKLSSLAQIMEDSDLCLRVLAKSKKVISLSSL